MGVQCIGTAMVERVMDLFLKQRHQVMSGARYVRRNKENLIVKMQSDNHRWWEHGKKRRKCGVHNNGFLTVAAGKRRE